MQAFCRPSSVFVGNKGVYVSTLIYQVFRSPSVYGSSFLFLLFLLLLLLFIASNLSSRAVLSSEFSVVEECEELFFSYYV